MKTVSIFLGFSLVSLEFGDILLQGLAENADSSLVESSTLGMTMGDVGILALAEMLQRPNHKLRTVSASAESVWSLRGHQAVANALQSLCLGGYRISLQALVKKADLLDVRRCWNEARSKNPAIRFTMRTRYVPSEGDEESDEIRVQVEPGPIWKSIRQEENDSVWPMLLSCLWLRREAIALMYTAVRNNVDLFQVSRT